MLEQGLTKRFIRTPKGTWCATNADLHAANAEAECENTYRAMLDGDLEAAKRYATSTFDFFKFAANDFRKSGRAEDRERAFDALHALESAELFVQCLDPTAVICPSEDLPKGTKVDGYLETGELLPKRSRQNRL